MDEACGSKGNILVSGEGCTAYDGEIFLARWLFGGQRHEDYETEYFNVYHHRDERGPRLRQLPDSKIVNVEELYTDVEKRNSPAYNEMLARSDTGNCLHARLDGPDDSWIVWTAADPVDDAGWSSQRVETVARILPHVRQFVRVRLALVNASFHPGGAGARTRKEQHGAGCVRGIVYKVFVSGKEAVRAVVRVARMQVWPGPQSAFGHWWRGAVRDPVWETEILAAVPPESPAEGNFRGLLFHGSFHPGGAGARTRKEQHGAGCVRGIVYKVFVSGKEAVRAVVRVARMQVWPGPQSAFGHWWRGAVRDPVWETEILAAVPPESPAEGNFRGLLFHGRALGTTMADLLDNTRCGIIQLDPRGQIVATNGRALELLRKGDGLSDDTGGLGARTPQEDATLQSLLARALPRFGGGGVSGSMMVTRSVGSEDRKPRPTALPQPPSSVRARIWSRQRARHGIESSHDDARSLACEYDVTPGMASGVTAAAELVDGGGLDAVRCGVRSLARVLSKEEPPQSVPDRFDPGLVRADTDLDALARRLAGTGPGPVSLCLKGPLGTGKSAFVRYLAERMGLEVVQKRASDLMSKWVGDTEKRIAEAFAEARDAGSFLVFDEADSLLADRRFAVRSWKVSQVNEMLTWMEAHPLPFACTTNFGEHLDPATLRRFAFKVMLDYLAPEQVEAAFQRFFALSPPVGLARLPALTPGDFAVVRRKAELLGRLQDLETLAGMLRAECDAKPDRPRPIGFRA